MIYFIYDRTFEGLLTCIHDAYFRKEFPQKLISEQETIPLFVEAYKVISDPEKAERVLASLKKKISKSALEMLFVCSLSEDLDTELCIFNYIRKTFDLNQSIELNFADTDVLALSKMYKKIQQEETRMRQFVRFQKTADGIFFAFIEPRYNVLPITADFFQDRFADQQWIVYDVKRKYGLYYNLEKVEEVFFDDPDNLLTSGKLQPEQMDLYEQDFQNLWKQYFKSIAIQQRKNPKLQKQFMPKRFWKYLIEKQ